MYISIILVCLIGWIKCEAETVSAEAAEITAVKLAASTLSLTDCGKENLITLNGFSLTPFPIKSPGNLVANSVMEISETIKGPIKVKVDMTKKIGPFNLPIPCMNNVGSCTYNDLCSILSSFKSCPLTTKNAAMSAPCSCPIRHGTYNINDFLVQIPSKVPAGQYSMKLRLQNTELGLLSCHLIKFAVI